MTATRKPRDTAPWIGAWYTPDVRESCKASTSLGEATLRRTPGLVAEWARANMDEGISFTIAFVSPCKAFISVRDYDGDDEGLVPYSVSPDRRVLFEGYPADITLTFSDDFSRIVMSFEHERFKAILTRVE